LAESTNIPIAATFLRKSAVSERHPLYIGLYEGVMGRAEVTEFVESSDCILLLGAFMIDLNTGMYTARLDLDKCINATSEQVSISRHFYHDLTLNGFLGA
jgi:indolepyruvate decarboxylase